MMTRSIAAIGVAVALLLASCGSDDDGAGSTDPPATAAPATDAPDTPDPPPPTDAPPATDAPPTEPAPTEPAATEPPSTEPPGEAPSFAATAGLGTVELSPTAAGEPQPLLAWTPVDGAASYRLAVLAADGKPYWAWLGSETEVRFGGAPDGGGQTAVLFEPMTWAVVALGDDGLPIAASPRGTLTP